MIVIERNGRTIVITGWPAWVVGAVAVVVMATVLALLAFLVLGITVGVVAFMLLAIPTLAIIALLPVLFQSRRP